MDIDDRLIELRKMIRDLEATLEHRDDIVQTRITKCKNRITDLNEKVDSLSASITSINSLLASLDKQMNEIENIICIPGGPYAHTLMESCCLDGSKKENKV